jgi:hypothetical protein
MPLFRIAAAAVLLFAFAPEQTARAVNAVLGGLGVLGQDAAAAAEARALEALKPVIAGLERPEARALAEQLVALCRAEPARCESLARDVLKGAAARP